MQITVKLFAMFRDGRFKAEVHDYTAGTPCRQVAAMLEIPEEALGIVLVNGRHAPLEQELQEGDVLSLFPLVGGG